MERQIAGKDHGLFWNAIRAHGIDQGPLLGHHITNSKLTWKLRRDEMVPALSEPDPVPGRRGHGNKDAMEGMGLDFHICRFSCSDMGVGWKTGGKDAYARRLEVNLRNNRKRR